MSIEDIYSEWKKKRLPIISGIIYCNGDIDSIDADYIKVNGRYERLLVNKGRTNIGALSLEKPTFGFSSIIIHKKITCNDLNIIVYCGSGSYGGDGFIVIESIDSKTIKWIAFFDESNEFINCEIGENKIIAYNNMEEKWIFDVNRPSDMYVINNNNNKITKPTQEVVTDI
ncbi:MAG: hypothetical protein FWH57_05570 [Oscillospiraceae bacterium]|nr:hypothetical protein [Oscillospiraceae bacterium]